MRISRFQILAYNSSVLSDEIPSVFVVLIRKSFDTRKLLLSNPVLSSHSWECNIPFIPRNFPYFMEFEYSQTYTQNIICSYPDLSNASPFLTTVFEIHFNTILPFTFTFPKWFISLNVSEQMFYKFYLALCVLMPCWSRLQLHAQPVSTRVGNLIVATIYLQLIRNRYMFRSFTVPQWSHQHCVQPVASDVEVTRA